MLAELITYYLLSMEEITFQPVYRTIHHDLRDNLHISGPGSWARGFEWIFLW
jgi:hypothetical protein